MSGPKSYGYRVDTEALERAREQAAIGQAISRLTLRYAAIAAEAAQAREVYGEDVDVVTPLVLTIGGDASVDALREQERELARALERDASRLHEQTTTIARSLLSQGVELDISVSARDARAVIAARNASSPQQEIVDGDLEPQIQRLLSRLSSRSPEDLQTVRRAIAASLSADGARRLLALDALRVAISNANEHERDRERARTRMDELAAQLDGLDREAVAPARERLAAAAGSDPDEQALENLRLTVERAVETARAVEQRRYVAAEIARAFSDLGYNVSEGFTVGIVADGYIDVSNGDDKWDGYAVRVRLPTDDQHVAFNLVRGPAWRADQAAHDVEIERTWCSDVPRLQDAMSGVELDAKRLTPPGEIPLQEVDMPVPVAHKTTRKQQERQL